MERRVMGLKKAQGWGSTSRRKKETISDCENLGGEKRKRGRETSLKVKTRGVPHSGLEQTFSRGRKKRFGGTVAAKGHLG